MYRYEGNFVSVLKRNELRYYEQEEIGICTAMKATYSSC